jgi:hypothetical protein
MPAGSGDQRNTSATVDAVAGKATITARTPRTISCAAPAAGPRTSPGSCVDPTRCPSAIALVAGQMRGHGTVQLIDNRSVLPEVAGAIVRVSMATCRLYAYRPIKVTRRPSRTPICARGGGVGRLIGPACCGPSTSRRTEGPGWPVTPDTPSRYRGPSECAGAVEGPYRPGGAVATVVMTGTQRSATIAVRGS